MSNDNTCVRGGKVGRHCETHGLLPIYPTGMCAKGEIFARAEEGREAKGSTEDDWKELEVSPGEWIGVAFQRLAKHAPAFMVFNGTRVTALEGDSADALCRKWSELREARREGEAVGCSRPHVDDTLREEWERQYQREIEKRDREVRDLTIRMNDFKEGLADAMKREQLLDNAVSRAEAKVREVVECHRREVETLQRRANIVTREKDLREGITHLIKHHREVIDEQVLRAKLGKETEEMKHGLLGSAEARRAFVAGLENLLAGESGKLTLEPLEDVREPYNTMTRRQLVDEFDKLSGHYNFLDRKLDAYKRLASMQERVEEVAREYLKRDPLFQALDRLDKFRDEEDEKEDARDREEREAEERDRKQAANKAFQERHAKCKFAPLGYAIEEHSSACEHPAEYRDEVAFGG